MEKEKRIIDLHSHSTFSDGSESPAELIDIALRTGLSCLALTDHDTINGVPHAIAAAENTALEVIPGVELSTFYKKHEIHIVGLFVDHTDKKFKSELNQIRFLREERNHKMCAKLHTLGIDIDYDNMVEIYKSNMITRAHIADYLLDKGYISTRKEAFEKYIGSHCPAFIQWEKIYVIKGIELILAAGGVPILAHPVAYKMDFDELDALVKNLSDNGLMGMEVFYSTNSESFTEKSKNLANKYGLLKSGGSDYHGRTKPLIKLGTGMGGLRISYDLLAPIRRAAVRSRENASIATTCDPIE